MPEYDIQCAFGDQVVDGVYMETSDEMLAVCVSPAFDEPGLKNVRVTVRDSNYSVVFDNNAQFYASKCVLISIISLLDYSYNIIVDSGF